MAVLSKPASFQQQARIPALIAVAIILIVRGQILDLSKRALSRRPQLQAPKATPEELQEAIKQLYVDEEDGSKTILVPFRDRVSKVSPSSSLLPLVSSLANANKRYFTRFTFALYQKRTSPATPSISGPSRRLISPMWTRRL